MAFCVKCGKELEDDWEFCQNCGTPVKKEIVEDKQEGKTEEANKEENAEKVEEVKTEEEKKEEEKPEEIEAEKEEEKEEKPEEVETEKEEEKEEEKPEEVETEKEEEKEEEKPEELEAEKGEKKEEEKPEEVKTENEDTIKIETEKKEGIGSKLKNKWKNLSRFYKFVVISFVISGVLLLISLDAKEALPFLISILQIALTVVAVLIHKEKIKTNKKWLKDVLVILALLGTILNLKSYPNNSKKYDTQTSSYIEQKVGNANTPYSSKQCTEKKFEAVKEDFKSVGFNNISTEAIYDLEKNNGEKVGNIESVSINGITDFEANKEFKTNSKIIIKYHDLKKIAIPLSSETIATMKAEEVIAQLETAGFLNMKTNEEYDIDPDVDKSEFKNSVSINGVTSFEKGQEFPMNEEIKITVHRPFEKYTVKIDIDFIPNILFDKYNVDFEFNGETKTINHGEDKSFEFRVVPGLYKGTFKSTSSSSVTGSIELNVIGDTNAAYAMSCSSESISLKEKYVENKGNVKENEAMVPNSYLECWYNDYKDIEERFKAAGFTNITFEEQKDIYFGITPEGEVSKVSINGKTDFKRGEIFPKDASVVITYHVKVDPPSSESSSTPAAPAAPATPQQPEAKDSTPPAATPDAGIVVPMSSWDATASNYKEVEEKFRGAGFTNITLEKVEDVKPSGGWFKDGSVQAVSIDGKTSFGKTDKFNPNAGIVIKYHTYPQYEYTAVTVSTMMKDLESNAANAKDKYLDKYFEISGKISNIDSDAKYISLRRSNYDIVGVSCYVNSDSVKETIKSLKTGQNVKVRCQVSSVGEVLGYSCNIIEIVK